MKAFLTPVLLPVFTLLLAVAPLSRLEAQQSEFKPAVVVSVASIDKIMDDMTYLADVGGARENATMFKGMVGLMTAGVDPKRPSGAYFTFKGAEEPVAVAFIPVTDLKGLLKIHEGTIGEPEDVGDGLLRIDGPNGMPVYLKDTGTWAFASQDKNLLAATPADPAKLLGGLDKKYTLAARVMVRNIPAELREMAIRQMQQGIERQLEEAAESDDENRELMEALSRNNLESVKRLVEESDEIEIGWAVDSMAKNTYIDFSMTAVPGTKLAAQMATVKSTKSDYAGFLLENAAASLLISHEPSQEDIARWTSVLDSMNKRAIEAIENDSDLESDKEKAAAKEIVSSLIGVLRKTAEGGKLDGGAAVLLGEAGGTTVAFGGRLSDTAELDRALRKAAKLAEREEDFPGIKFDAGKQGDVALHTMSIPLDDAEEQARAMFGDELDVTFGVGGGSFYLVLGKDATATLKKIIEKSAAAAGTEQPPMQLHVAVAPIIDFIAEMDDNPVTAMVAASADKVRGNDSVSIVSTPIKNGSRTRVQIDEGVLKLLGEVGQTLGMGAGAPGAPIPGAF